jgi:hypothetical protein
MSDDLVKRLDRFDADDLHREAADRIEELEKACDEWAEVSQSNYQRAKAAEANLAKAVWELERLGFDFESVVGRDLMQAIIEEIKGESHE